MCKYERDRNEAHKSIDWYFQQIQLCIMRENLYLMLMLCLLYQYILYV